MDAHPWVCRRLPAQWFRLPWGRKARDRAARAARLAAEATQVAEYERAVRRIGQLANQLGNQVPRDASAMGNRWNGPTSAYPVSPLLTRGQTARTRPNSRW